jgi:hypothetical protein
MPLASLAATRTLYRTVDTVCWTMRLQGSRSTAGAARGDGALRPLTAGRYGW